MLSGEKKNCSFLYDHQMCKQEEALFWSLCGGCCCCETLACGPSIALTWCFIKLKSAQHVHNNEDNEVDFLTLGESCKTSEKWWSLKSSSAMTEIIKQSTAKNDLLTAMLFTKTKKKYSSHYIQLQVEHLSKTMVNSIAAWKYVSLMLRQTCFLRKVGCKEKHWNNFSSVSSAKMLFMEQRNMLNHLVNLLSFILDFLSWYKAMGRLPFCFFSGCKSELKINSLQIASC